MREGRRLRGSTTWRGVEVEVVVVTAAGYPFLEESELTKGLL